MFTHRPSTARPRRVSAAVAASLALSLAASLAPSGAAAAGAQPGTRAAAPHAKTSPTKKSKTRKPTARRAEDDGLIVRWTGTPLGGSHAGKSVSESVAFGGDLFLLSHTSTIDSESIWAPIIDDGTVGAPAAPGGQSEILPTKDGHACFSDPSFAPVWRAQKAYARGLQRSVEQIEALRTDAAARKRLPAGPTIPGHTTVTTTVATWETIDRSGASVAFDAATGAVLRITPTGMPDFAVDLTAWSVTQPTPAQLKAAAPDRDQHLDLYVTGPCH